MSANHAVLLAIIIVLELIDIISTVYGLRISKLLKEGNGYASTRAGLAAVKLFFALVLYAMWPIPIWSMIAIIVLCAWVVWNNVKLIDKMESKAMEGVVK